MASGLTRYPRAFLCAQRLLARLGAPAFPLDMPSVFAQLGGRRPVLLAPLSEYRTWQGGDGLAVRDAICFYDPERKIYLVLYNDRGNAARLRFSLAHELGHILLGHLDARRGGSAAGDEAVRLAHEGEANTFAGNLLAPPVLIHACLRGGPFRHDLIANVFGLSLQATRDYRQRDYRDWLVRAPSGEEVSLLERCGARLLTLSCPDCGASFRDDGARFCPYCGAAGPVISDEPEEQDMDRIDIETNEHHRVIACPRCGNREYADGARFCLHCGAPAVNACAETSFWGNAKAPCSRGETLPVHARFCPYCGNDSLFSKEGFFQET